MPEEGSNIHPEFVATVFCKHAMEYIHFTDYTQHIVSEGVLTILYKGATIAVYANDAWANIIIKRKVTTNV